MSACERTWFSKEQPMTCERFSISCRKTSQVDLPSTNGLGGRNEITLSIKRNSLPKRRRLKKMQLVGTVIGIKPDGTQITKKINRKLNKLVKDNDFSPFQIGSGINIIYINAHVVENNKVVHLYRTR